MPASMSRPALMSMSRSSSTAEISYVNFPRLTPSSIVFIFLLGPAGRLSGRASQCQSASLAGSVWDLNARLLQSGRNPKAFSISTGALRLRPQAHSRLANPQIAIDFGSQHNGLSSVPTHRLRSTGCRLPCATSEERPVLRAESHKEERAEAESFSVRFPGASHFEERRGESVVCPSPC